jgi:hypothetical protein
VRSLIRLFLAAVVAAAAAENVRLELEVVKPEVLQQRLEKVQRDLRARRETLEALFHEAGCADLTSQPVPRSREPNVICTLAATGEDARTIVVGAHFDLANRGMGVADNWSGAAMLPSLYQSLAKHPRRHRFVFVNFAAEEIGLIGSREFVRKLSQGERAAVSAMVNLDTLGLSAPTIWPNRTDKALASAYVRVAQTLGQTPAGVNVDKVGDDDSHSFVDVKIPVISIHSVTQETLPILHSVRDTLKAIQPEHYYSAYRLASLYLAYIDATLD